MSTPRPNTCAARSMKLRKMDMREDRFEAKALNAVLFVFAIVLAMGIALAAKADGGGWSTNDALSSFPIHKTDLDEEPQKRKRRMLAIAEAIDFATTSKKERAWLLMTARRESALARFVDLDHQRCSEGHGGVCDSGRAWSLWQLHGTTREGGRVAAAQIALTKFRKQANACAARGYPYWQGGISAYGTGNRCDWPEAEERYREMAHILVRLQ